MSAELNLTEDQKQRIEAAKTPEEKAAVIREAMGALRELSAEQLEAVSGGVWIPPTHEEIDACWDYVQSIMNHYGQDMAEAAAFEMGLIPPKSASSSGYYFEKRRTISECRAFMHREIDGENDELASAYFF
ncbi:MAG: hypothetical protein J6S63_10095 [Atopobiaceae bacterium]|nr:hypothetical protein [Atopobiaceae bacterium]